jgi:hypothetical protein
VGEATVVLLKVPEPDQAYPATPVGVPVVSVIVPDAQSLPLLVILPKVGFALTVTEVVYIFVQPAPELTVTEKISVPGAAPDTVGEAAAVLLKVPGPDHAYPATPIGVPVVSVIVPDAHSVPLLIILPNVGDTFTVSIAVTTLRVQPVAVIVAVTVNIPLLSLEFTANIEAVPVIEVELLMTPPPAGPVHA